MTGSLLLLTGGWTLELQGMCLLTALALVHRPRVNQDQDDPRKPPATTEFGIFAPVGYLVAAFPKREAAQHVQRDLMTGGYDETDCGLYTCEEVVTATECNLAENTGFLSRLGWADETVKIHLDAAKERAVFLLIYAPHDTDVERAINVIRRVPFKFVHRSTALPLRSSNNHRGCRES